MKLISVIPLACFLLFFLNQSNAQIKTKQEKGYFNITNIVEPQYLHSLDSSTLVNGVGFIKKFGVSFSTINGFFINPNLSIGLGIGFQTSQYKSFVSSNTPDSLLLSSRFKKGNNIALLPIFADFRFYPQDHRNDLFLLLDVGYAPLIKIKDNIDKETLDGGAFIKLGAGYKIEMSESVSFVPSLNLNAQRFGDNTAVGGSIALGLLF